MSDLGEPNFNVHESRKHYMVRKEYERRKDICNKLNGNARANLTFGIIIAIASLFFIKISSIISIIVFLIGIYLIYISRKQKKKANIEYNRLNKDFVVRFGTVYVRKHGRFKLRRRFRRRFRKR